MPVFEYNAISTTGKKLKGNVDAENIRIARQKLKSQGIYVTDIKEGLENNVSKKGEINFGKNKISLKDLSIITSQLTTLIIAGLPLVNALQALTEQTESRNIKRILTDVRESVEEGNAFHKSLANFPKAFPKLYVNMIESGEASGKLDSILENLSKYLEGQLALRRQVTSSLFYPTLMFAFCTLVVIGLLAFVVPSIVEIFEKQGGTLPLPTRIVVGISDIIIHYWWVFIIGIVGIFTSIKKYAQTEKGKFNIDLLLIKLPLIGKLYTKVATARIASTIGTLFSGGVQLLSCLDIGKNIVNNVHFRSSLEQARDGVEKGKSLSSELSKSGLFPPLLSHMIAVGEKSGQLEQMLTRAAKAYEDEVKNTLAAITSLIEPLMIIGLGGIVFSIVISILMPMVGMIDLIQG
ncbi:MAG: type II secretion system inner membrane protein GspF [Bdellovibrionota bacterium]|nr:type II secretion system inner membrane protein GspF [Bdellovibrionota bacterium]